MNRAVRLLLLTCVALAAGAQPAGDWRGWRYWAPISANETDSTRLVRANVPAWVTARSQPGWVDLRVVDDAGREVPYVLHAREEQRERVVRAAKLLEVTYAPGENTQGIVDLGADAGVHNSIEVHTAEPDFFVWVEVAISPDAHNWRILRERVPIYRFRAEGLEGNRAIRYNDSQSRYLRLRVLEGKRRFPLEGVTVARDRVAEAEREQMDATFHHDAAPPRQQTWWKADIGSAQPISEIRFAVAEPDFYRALRVSASNDGQLWRQVGSGDIFRVRRKGYGEEDSDRERVCLNFSETRARYWRIEVLDRDDPPLEKLGISIFTTPRRVVFRQEPGRAYRLLYGNEKAAAPQYSLGRLLEAREIDGAEIVSLGVETAIPAAAPIVPWTERHKFVLWIALGAAVAVLGTLAVRAMKS